MTKQFPQAAARSYRFFYWAASILVCAGIVFISMDAYIQHTERSNSLQLKNQMLHLYHTKAQSSTEQANEFTELTKEASTAVKSPTENERFQSLLAINKEIIGWLRVEGTSVDYPVLQHKDNDYYLNRDASGKKSIYGSVFMDYRLDTNQEQRNLVIYGHNMIDGSMFGSLGNYKNKDFFTENRKINWGIQGKTSDWEIFSVYTIDARKDTVDISYENDDAFLLAIDQYRKKSMYQAAVTLQKDDQILTLVTCSNETDDTRLVIHAVKKGPRAPFS
ncbi:class B sortase [Paenibacillus periandrae]|uniref:class B sortase n=1 Tax=Paenibacillus periandrae TaxID=1761741 RepID=UPI001F08A4EB|nr:class B sortase [Paenibacillus periandrae]